MKNTSRPHSISKKKPGSSFQMRLSISYSVLLLLTLIIGVTITQLSYRQVQKNQNRQNRLSLYAAVTQFDNVLNNIESMERQLSEDASFNQLADSLAKGSDFYYNAYLTQRVLKNLSPVEQALPIRRSFLYFLDTDQILSSAEFAPFSFYGANTLQISEENAAFLRTYLLRWQRLIPMSAFQAGSQNFLYIQPVNRSLTYAPNKIRVLYCCELDYHKLMQLFSHIDLYGNGYFMAYDRYHDVVLDLAQDAPAYLPVALDTLHYEDQVTSYVLEDGRRMLITEIFSGKTQWRWYLVQPYEKVYDSLIFYRNLFFVLTAAAIILGALFAILLSAYNAIPYQYLSDELSAQQKLAASLYSLIEENRPAVTENCLRKLLEGTILSNEELAQIKAALNLNPEENRYQVLCVETYAALPELSAQNGALPAETETLLQNPAPEPAASQRQRNRALLRLIRESFPHTGYLLKIGASSYAILLAIPESATPQDSLAQIKQSFQNLRRQLGEQQQLRIHGGLGSASNILSYIWRSCSQAKEALQISTEYQPFVSHAELENATDAYYFPESLSVQLSGYLSTGNRDQVDAIFTELAQQNFVTRTLSCNQTRWLLSDIRSTLYRKRQSLGNQSFANPSPANQSLEHQSPANQNLEHQSPANQNLEHQSPANQSLENADAASLNDKDAAKQPLLDIIDQQFSQEISFSMLHNIALELCQVFGSASEKSDVIGNIQAYIVEHFSDANLSLTSISQEFGLSENYISSLFKRETQENFSVWLIQLRMTKAKELVIDSELPLSELYLHLGYTNAAAFRKVFKKTYGVSPREMREKKG